MAKIKDTLDLVTQRTGSTSGTPQNAAEAAGFRTGIKLDIASIMGQMNNVYHPLFNTLSSEDTANALTLGLSGNVIFTHIGATAADASAYWDTGLGRTRTIKETIDSLLTQLSDLENQISFTVDVDAYDDATVLGLIGNNQLNLKQLRLDTMGDNYGFDNDGLKDLVYPLSQHLDAMGAFFTGYPGSGNTYPGTPVYPTLALAVNLSDVVLDTTIPISTVTGLATGLANILTYVGMTDSSDVAPTYSTHGAITTVTDGHQLERAIQALDAGIAASSGAYSTTSNVTSNTAGDYTADDFVHGSPSLDDDTIVGHDSRFMFDKTKAAFRAGSVTGTTWDDASRGMFSAAFGLDNTASGIASFVGGGTENIAAAVSSTIAGGGASGQGNTIGATSTVAFVGGGTQNAIGAVGASTGAFIGSGSQNAIGTTGVSTNSVIGGGSNNTVTTATHATIAGGATNTVGATGGVVAGGSSNSVAGGTYSAIVGGETNAITVGSHIVIVGGQENTSSSAGSAIVGGGGSGVGNNIANASTGSFIGAGASNAIGGTTVSTYSVIVGGQGNKTDNSDHSTMGGGYNNIILDSDYAVIAGGGASTLALANQIDDSPGSFIGSGLANDILGFTGTYNVIVGGGLNVIGDNVTSVQSSFIGGGANHLIDGGANNGTIGGGTTNTINGISLRCTIGGGGYNSITDSIDSLIAGGGAGIVGNGNQIKTSGTSVIGGGGNNDIFGFVGNYNTIAGGISNVIGDDATSTSYNFIGGGGANLIDGGSEYGVVCGGTQNDITTSADHSFVGGGEENVVSSAHSVIVGGGGTSTGNAISNASTGSFIGSGRGNTIGSAAASTYSVICGGYGNDITDSTYAVIAGGGSVTGGSENTISGSDNATVGGGTDNQIGTAGAGTYGTICGGIGNTITVATHATIGGGNGNVVSANYGAIVGGSANTASGAFATASGRDNVASGQYSTVQGYKATSDAHGGHAHSGGNFSAAGDAQFERAIWRIQTTDATANVEAFLDGSSARFAIDDDSTYAFFIRGVARRTDVNGESAHYTLEGTVDRNAGVTALVSTVTKVVVDEDTAAWDVQVTANDTNDALQIDVTGEALKTINWVFSGEFVKVTG